MRKIKKLISIFLIISFVCIPYDKCNNAYAADKAEGYICYEVTNKGAAFKQSFGTDLLLDKFTMTSAKSTLNQVFNQDLSIFTKLFSMISKIKKSSIKKNVKEYLLVPESVSKSLFDNTPVHMSDPDLNTKNYFSDIDLPMQVWEITDSEGYSTQYCFFHSMTNNNGVLIKMEDTGSEGIFSMRMVRLDKPKNIVMIDSIAKEETSQILSITLLVSNATITLKNTKMQPICDIQYSGEPGTVEIEFTKSDCDYLKYKVNNDRYIYMTVTDEDGKVYSADKRLHLNKKKILSVESLQ